MLIYLDWLVAVEEKELSVWRVAAKANRNIQTLGSVRYHRDALTAHQRAARVARDLYDRRRVANSMPLPTLSTLTVIERN